MTRYSRWEDAMIEQTTLHDFTASHTGRRYIDEFQEDSNRRHREGARLPDGLMHQLQMLTLTEAEPVWIAPDVVDLVMAARETFKPEKILGSDAFVPSGFALLSKPITIYDGPDEDSTVRALAWTSVIGDAWNKPGAAGSFWISFYNYLSDRLASLRVATPSEIGYAADAAQRLDYNRQLDQDTLDRLAPDGLNVVERLLTHHYANGKPVAPHYRTRLMLSLQGRDKPLEASLDVPIDWFKSLPTAQPGDPDRLRLMHHFQWTWGTVPSEMEFTVNPAPGEGEEETFNRSVSQTTTVQTLWRLSQQLVPVAHRAPRGIRRQASRKLKRDLQDVNVVVLRREQNVGPHEETDRHYSVTFLVRGYWATRHTKEGPRQVWVRPHIKGQGPFKETRRAWEFSR